MKTCTVYGDLSADSTDEQYPKVAVCDECLELELTLGEDCQVVTVMAYEPIWGNACYFCDKTEDEENAGG